MKVYCTSRNSKEVYTDGTLHLSYLGTSIEDAETAVAELRNFQREDDDFPKASAHLYSIIPDILNWEMIQFYLSGPWWASIVMFELSEEDDAD